MCIEPLGGIAMARTMKNINLLMITLSSTATLLFLSYATSSMKYNEAYNWEQLSFQVFYLMEQGEYAAARNKAERALSEAEKIFGPEHCNTATSLRNLAKVLFYQKEYNQAGFILKKALSIEMGYDKL